MSKFRFGNAALQLGIVAYCAVEPNTIKVSPQSSKYNENKEESDQKSQDNTKNVHKMFPASSSDKPKDISETPTANITRPSDNAATVSTNVPVIGGIGLATVVLLGLLKNTHVGMEVQQFTRYRRYAQYFAIVATAAMLASSMNLYCGKSRKAEVVKQAQRDSTQA